MHLKEPPHIISSLNNILKHPKETYTPYFLIKKELFYKKKDEKTLVASGLPTASEIDISLNEVPQLID